VLRSDIETHKLERGKKEEPKKALKRGVKHLQHFQTRLSPVHKKEKGEQGKATKRKSSYKSWGSSHQGEKKKKTVRS